MSDKTYEMVKEVLCQESPMDSLLIYAKHFNELKDCRFIFFGNKGGIIPECLHLERNKYSILGITEKPRVLLLDEVRYKEMLMGKVSNYNIDVCIAFDTQVVSYIERMFQAEDRRNHSDLYGILKEILNKKIDYDCLPYMMENSNKLNDEKTKIGVYSSLISYLQFQECDYNDFLKFPEKKVPVNKVIRKTDYLVERMRKMNSEKELKGYYEMILRTRILITKTVQIQFELGHKGVKFKIDKLIDFVNNELGIIAERELSVCYLYLKNKNEVSKFFKQIQKNARDIFKTIESMAWDLTHIRIIEQSIQFDVDENKPMCLRSLLTFDNGLRDILRTLPLKAIGFYKGVPVCAFEKPFIELVEEIDLKDKIISNREKRLQIGEQVNLSALLHRVEGKLSQSLQK